MYSTSFSLYVLSIYMFSFLSAVWTWAGVASISLWPWMTAHSPCSRCFGCSYEELYCRRFWRNPRNSADSRNRTNWSDLQQKVIQTKQRNFSHTILSHTLKVKSRYTISTIYISQYFSSKAFHKRTDWNRKLKTSKILHSKLWYRPKYYIAPYTFKFSPLSLWMRMCSRMDAKLTNSGEESSTVSVQERSSRVFTEYLRREDDRMSNAPLPVWLSNEWCPCWNHCCYQSNSYNRGRGTPQTIGIAIDLI